jgi:hypothetical protein
MDHWDSRKPTRDQREPILLNQVLKGRPKTHQYVTRSEFARTNHFPIFAGSDIADFVSDLDVHDLSSPAMFQKRPSASGQTVEKNVFSLYFCEMTSQCISTDRRKNSIGFSVAVHCSVGVVCTKAEVWQSAKGAKLVLYPPVNTKL